MKLFQTDFVRTTKPNTEIVNLAIVFTNITEDKLQLSMPVLFFLWRCGPTLDKASSFTRFLDHTQRRITRGGTPLIARSARLRDPYLTKHNTHNTQTTMPLAGLEPTISAGKRPQTYALDGAAT